MLIVIALLLAACAAPPAQKISGYALYPYQTPTPSPVSAPNVIVMVATPQPTPTPVVYIIQSGDTFSQLGERFKIPQDELRAANPGINPNGMPVGGTLIIPDISTSPAAAWTPTPVPVPISQISCHASADPGWWCFALIENTTPAMLENVAAQINLLDANHTAVMSQTAFALLDVIPPNSALPVYVFFPNAGGDLTPQAQLLSAVQLDVHDARYLPAEISHAVVEINWDGLTARVNGRVELPAAAQKVWVVAVAYAEDGRVVGLKRWEGATPRFDFSVASLGPAIEFVAFVVEAR